MLRTACGRELLVNHPGAWTADGTGRYFAGARFVLDGEEAEGHVAVTDEGPGTAADCLPARGIRLHVSGTACPPLRDEWGEPVPQVLLPVPPEWRRRYIALAGAEWTPRCYGVDELLTADRREAILGTLAAERLEERAWAVLARLDRLGGRWDDACFVTLARSHGYGFQGDSFEQWASALPFRALEQVRHDPLDVEAFFLGHAGLLASAPPANDDYLAGLRRRWSALRQRFALPEASPAAAWTQTGASLRDLPHTRIAALAQIYHRSPGLADDLAACDTAADVACQLRTSLTDYWRQHRAPGRSETLPAPISDTRAVTLLTINAAVPVVFARGIAEDDAGLRARAVGWLAALPGENNHITRPWDHAGFPSETALHSQAILHLQTRYCTLRRCLDCPLGREYLTSDEPAACSHSEEEYPF